MTVRADIQYFLEPGHIYFTREPAVVRTVLGSCVAVCLWDRQRRYGGMNHFVYPSVGEQQKATAKFGNAATRQLIRMMEEAGCRVTDIEARLFGGGRRNGEDAYAVSDDNVRVAREVLKRCGIPVVSEDVGGNTGRKVIFDTSTGNAAVLKVREISGS